MAGLAGSTNARCGTVDVRVRRSHSVVAAVLGFHDFFLWVFTGNGGYLDASGVLGYASGTRRQVHRMVSVGQ